MKVHEVVLENGPDLDNLFEAHVFNMCEKRLFKEGMLYHLSEITLGLSASKLPEFADRKLPHIVNIGKLASDE